MKQNAFSALLLLAICHRGLTAPAQPSHTVIFVVSRLSPEYSPGPMYAVATAAQQGNTIAATPTTTNSSDATVATVTTASTSVSSQMATTSPTTYIPSSQAPATTASLSQLAHSMSSHSFSSSVRKIPKTTFTHSPTPRPLESPAADSTRTDSSTSSFTTMSTLHLGPGLVRIASTSSAHPSSSSNAHVDDPETLDKTSGGSSNDENSYPAPVHKLIILSMVFLGFIGLSCACFLIAGSKRIRSFICRPCSERDDEDDTDLLAPTQEKEVATPPPSPPPPEQKEPVAEVAPRTRWLKLPTQILQSHAPPPPVPRTKQVKKKRVLDISSNFPRSRFSDSSSEGSQSIYSSSSSFDGDVTNDAPPRRTSDIEIVVTDTSGHLNSPEVNGERWSMEAQRLSSATDVPDDSRWSIEQQQRSSTVDVEQQLSVPQRLKEGIRWSLDPQRL